MPLFAAIGLDHPPHSMDKRLASQAAHRSYVVDNDEDIVLVGPLIDEADNRCGSFYIFQAENEQQVRDWFAREPYFQTDVYKDFVIRRFEPGVNRLPMQDWPMRRSATEEQQP